MKILYAGTPLFSIEPLRAIIENGFEVVGVLTQIDKPTGRSGKITSPPLKVFALEKGLPVYQFEKIKNNVEEIKSVGADIMITCAYGQILTQDIINAFPFGIYNIHASLLPKYRGASPIQSCLLNGEQTTGVTIMKTDIGLDTGDILLQKSCDVAEYENAEKLSNKLSVLGSASIVEVLKLIESGEARLIKQEEDKATLVKKISKEDGKIDFNKTREQINNLVRGLNPLPIAYAVCEGKNYNIFAVEKLEQGEFERAENGTIVCDEVKKGLIVQCEDGLIKILEIQASGGKRITGKDFCNGRKLQKGQKFN